MYFQVSFTMPSADDRPILHATDVKFAKCNGVNVLCVEPDIDLRRNYDDTFSQTSNISTFMSVSKESLLNLFICKTYILFIKLSN